METPASTHTRNKNVLTSAVGCVTVVIAVVTLTGHQCQLVGTSNVVLALEENLANLSIRGVEALPPQVLEWQLVSSEVVLKEGVLIPQIARKKPTKAPNV